VALGVWRHPFFVEDTFPRQHLPVFLDVKRGDGRFEEVAVAFTQHLFQRTQAEQLDLGGVGHDEAAVSVLGVEIQLGQGVEQRRHLKRIG